MWNRRLEAERIGVICHRLGKKAKVALRVNPSGEAQGGAMRMGGKPAPFGVDEENIDTCIRVPFSWIPIWNFGGFIYLLEHRSWIMRFW